MYEDPIMKLIVLYANFFLILALEAVISSAYWGQGNLMFLSRRGRNNEQWLSRECDIKLWTFKFKVCETPWDKESSTIQSNNLIYIITPSIILACVVATFLVVVTKYLANARVYFDYS